MFTTINTKLVTLFATLTGTGKPIQVVYNCPTDKISGYPAIIYYPSSFENSLTTNKDNMKGLNYKIFVVLEANVQGVSTAYSSMATVLDAVIKAFDEGWDQGGSTDGHRIWWKITSGDWVLSNSQGYITVSPNSYLTTKNATVTYTGSGIIPVLHSIF